MGASVREVFGARRIRHQAVTVRRLALGVTLATIAAHRAFVLAGDPTDPPDLAQVWLAARALLDGVDPYTAIGPDRALAFPYVFVYPLPAAVLALPLAPLPLPWAAAVFVFLGCLAFAWALTREGVAPLLAFASAGMLVATEEAQWSPLLAASLAIPALGALVVCKPTIGAALVAARPTWWPVAGGVVLLAIAFALRPHWLAEWHGALTREQPGAPERFGAIVQQSGGVLVLLALLRWRRPEARLLAVLACVPHTTLLYETVPLALVPRGWGESAAFVALSWVALWWMAHHPAMSPAARLAQGATLMLWCSYVPCVAMVLRRRNEA
jgi:hypothetical protein